MDHSNYNSYDNSIISILEWLTKFSYPAEFLPFFTPKIQLGVLCLVFCV